MSRFQASNQLPQSQRGNPNTQEAPKRVRRLHGAKTAGRGSSCFAPWRPQVCAPHVTSSVSMCSARRCMHTSTHKHIHRCTRTLARTQTHTHARAHTQTHTLRTHHVAVEYDDGQVAWLGHLVPQLLHCTQLFCTCAYTHIQTVKQR